MSRFLSGLGVVVALELRQRQRGAAWSVLLTVFTGLVAIVTALLTVALGTLTSGSPTAVSGGGGNAYSTLIFFVLLLGTLVVPALSGSAINGDRDSGTLATTQVTLVTTGQLVLGKFLAAWATALSFLVAALPFLVFSAVAGRLPVASVLIAVVVLALELGLVAALSVGLSGLLQRGVFSIAVSYLATATLSVGTLIAFGIVGLTVQSTVTSTTSYAIDVVNNECETPTTSEYRVPRYDYFWGILAANPYVVVADAVPTTDAPQTAPADLFGAVKLGVRSAQIAPELEQVYDECAGAVPEEPPTPREVVDSTTPSWFVGLAIHVLLAALALVGAWRSTRTPARRLARGSRVA